MSLITGQLTLHQGFSSGQSISSPSQMTAKTLAGRGVEIYEKGASDEVINEIAERINNYLKTDFSNDVWGRTTRDSIINLIKACASNPHPPKEFDIKLYEKRLKETRDTIFAWDQDTCKDMGYLVGAILKENETIGKQLVLNLLVHEVKMQNFQPGDKPYYENIFHHIIKIWIYHFVKEGHYLPYDSIKLNLQEYFTLLNLPQLKEIGKNYDTLKLRIEKIIAQVKFPVLLQHLSNLEKKQLCDLTCFEIVFNTLQTRLQDPNELIGEASEDLGNILVKISKIAKKGLINAPMVYTHPRKKIKLIEEPQKNLFQQQPDVQLLVLLLQRQLKSPDANDDKLWTYLQENLGKDIDFLNNEFSPPLNDMLNICQKIPQVRTHGKLNKAFSLYFIDKIKNRKVQPLDALPFIKFLQDPNLKKTILEELVIELVSNRLSVEQTKQALKLHAEMIETITLEIGLTDLKGVNRLFECLPDLNEVVLSFPYDENVSDYCEKSLEGLCCFNNIYKLKKLTKLELLFTRKFFSSHLISHANKKVTTKIMESMMRSISMIESLQEFNYQCSEPKLLLHAPFFKEYLTNWEEPVKNASDKNESDKNATDPTIINLNRKKESSG